MKKQEARILVIDDDSDVLLSARLLLQNHYAEIMTCRSPGQLNELLGKSEFDLILLDMNFRQGSFDGKEGIYWLKHILSTNEHYPVILMTAYGNIDMAVQALKTGGTDFIMKPWDNEKFMATVSSALQLGFSHRRLRRLEKTREYLQKDIRNTAGEMIGDSPAFREVKRIIAKVAPTDANILILGENGTGKQLVAQQIHQQSGRARNIFLQVDLGSLHQGLFESELFGAAKGAYTDSREERPGRFELADGGTIFLDEIANLPASLQSKLLDVLQNRNVIRLGENRPRPVDIRLICATNLELNGQVMKNEFRQDLLYRINTVEILLPPLRERDGDAVMLAGYFLEIYQARYHKPPLAFSAEALERISAYPWPGNIRELQHAVERAVIMTETSEIGVRDLNLTKQEDQMPPSRETLDLLRLEELTVRKALTRHQGNISKAATDLGLTRSALYRRLEKFNL